MLPVIKIALGVAAGLGLARFIRHRAWHRRHGGGCHGHGGGWRRGWHGPGSGRRFFHLWRELDLSPDQKDQVRNLWVDLRSAFGGLRYDTMRTMDDVLDAAVAEPFDPSRLDALAARHAEGHTQTAQRVAQAVKRLHDLLRPEQLEKLRAFMGGARSGGPAAGPYRTPA